jgi:hypothetical protein
VPTYSASRSRDERLIDFLESPFKSLRMLAAYETGREAGRLHSPALAREAAAAAEWYWSHHPDQAR